MRDDGYVVCWGDLFAYWNEGDLLKDKKLKSIVVSNGGFACGLRADDSAVCWGKGSYHDVDGDGRRRSYGDEDGYSFSDDARFRFLSAGEHHVCGLKTDETVVCIGMNDEGQASPPEGEKFVDIDSGRRHSCGVTKDGVILCWGANYYGQSHPPLR